MFSPSLSGESLSSRTHPRGGPAEGTQPPSHTHQGPLYPMTTSTLIVCRTPCVSPRAALAFLLWIPRDISAWGQWSKTGLPTLYHMRSLKGITNQTGASPVSCAPPVYPTPPPSSPRMTPPPTYPVRSLDFVLDSSSPPSPNLVSDSVH